MKHFTLILILCLITGCSVQNKPYTSQNQITIPKEGSYATSNYPSAANLADSKYTQAEADQKCADAWNYFKKELLQSNGGVLRSDDNTFVSEGQSYGMMLAVQNNDQVTFDKIWNWTKTNMQDNNPYGLFSWQVSASGEVMSHEPAPDGEEMIAMALFFASHRWGDKAAPYDYSIQAKKILEQILKFETTTDYYLTFNVSEKDKFNASYFMPAFYRLFSMYTGNTAWETVAGNSYNFIDNCQKESYGNTANGLVPDWCGKDGSLKKTGQDFSFDAMRVPFYIGLDAVWFGSTEARSKTYVDKVMGFFGPKYDTFGSKFQLDGKQLQDEHRTSWVGSFAGAAMGSSSDQYKINFFNHLMSLSFPTGQYRYYEVCWLNFGLLLSSGNFKIY